MNVREYWTVLREDKWLVGGVLVVCVAIAAAVALLLPRTYTSTAIFYVASPQTTTSSTDSYSGAQLSTERVKSYSELLTGPRVAADASALLGGTPSAQDIQKAISADSVAETVVLNLGVTEPTPQDAQLVGTAVATSFTRLVNSIESTGQPVNRPIVSTELIYPPTLPTFPAGPGTTMLLAAGLLAGVVLGVGAALGRRALRRAVDTPDVLEAALDAPVLTALPGLPRRPDRPALLLEPAPGRRGRRAARARDRAAAVRRLRTAVLAGAGDRRCLVVSGVRTEQGTTTVAVDLAVALALAGESVLLVDADLRRPALAQRLGLDEGRGLATVLGGAGWDGAVQRWSTGGLDILPAGPGLDRPGEAWGTTTAASALGSLRGSYTWVLLDASPVASTPESVDLARLADGVVLVARRGSARPEDLDAAAGGLRTVGAPVIGSVFTFAVDVPTAPVEAPRALPGGSSTTEVGADAEPAAPAAEAPAAGPDPVTEPVTEPAPVAAPAAVKRRTSTRKTAATRTPDPQPADDAGPSASTEVPAKPARKPRTPRRAATTAVVAGSPGTATEAPDPAEAATSAPAPTAEPTPGTAAHAPAVVGNGSGAPSTNGTTAGEPGTNGNGARPRRATRATTRASVPEDATTTVEGAETAEKPARTRTTRTRPTRTTGNGHGPESTENGTRPARTRSPRPAPTNTPTSGS